MKKSRLKSARMYAADIKCKTTLSGQKTSGGIRVTRVHSFHEKIHSEVRLKICSRHKKQMTFSGQKIVAGQRLNDN